MVSEEIKQVVYISISLMIVASVLWMFSIFNDITSDLANVRNTEMITQSSVKDYREFNKYTEGTILYGEDVIEAISKYKNSEIEIYVDNVSNTGKSFQTKEGGYKYNSSTFNYSNPSFFEIANLKSIFSVNFKYKAQLVYDLNDVTDESIVVNTFCEVTGIRFVCVGTR